jgi:hypothetical protein
MEYNVSEMSEADLKNRQRHRITFVITVEDDHAKHLILN